MRAKKKRISNDDDDDRDDERVKSHAMAWVREVIPDRLLIGPPPRSKLDLRWLCEVKGVSHIFAMDLKGVDRYSDYLGDVKNGAPTINKTDVMLPVGDDALVTRNHAAQANWYNDRVRAITDVLLSDPKSVVFIHHQNGRYEEALMAFAVWTALGKPEAPRTTAELVAWRAQTTNGQLLDTEEQQILFEVVMQKVVAVKTVRPEAKIMSKWLLGGGKKIKI